MKKKCLKCKSAVGFWKLKDGRIKRKKCGATLFSYPYEVTLLTDNH